MGGKNKHPPHATGFGAEGGMSGCRPRHRAGGVSATSGSSDTTTSTHDTGQEASEHPEIGFNIGSYRVFSPSQASNLQGLRSATSGQARAAYFVEEGRKRLSEEAQHATGDA